MDDPRCWANVLNRFQTKRTLADALESDLGGEVSFVVQTPLKTGDHLCSYMSKTLKLLDVRFQI